MKKANNRSELKGLHFGRLVVLEYSHTRNKKAYWLCLCECGNKTVTQAAKIKSGHTQSCGCLQRKIRNESLELGHRLNFRHGWIGTPTYKSWDAAKQRCFNPNDDHYPYYGAIGVTMCDRWRKSFKHFLDDMGERPEGKTIDRWPDPYGNYEPGNCRWATPKEQASNRRNTIAPKDMELVI